VLARPRQPPVGHDDRDSRTHCLDEREAERLLERREHEEFRAPVDLGQRLVREAADEVHAIPARAPVPQLEQAAGVRGRRLEAPNDREVARVPMRHQPLHGL